MQKYFSLLVFLFSLKTFRWSLFIDHGISEIFYSNFVRDNLLLSKEKGDIFVSLVIRRHETYFTGYSDYCACLGFL
jgi:hypothetical protein